MLPRREGSPLDECQLAELATCGAKLRKVTKAAKLAAFNGWTLAVFAGLSMLFAFGSLQALFVCIGMGVAAWNEFRGGRMVRRLEVRGLTRLGWNQVALAAVLIVYSAWSMAVVLTSPNPYAEELGAYPDAAGMLSSIGNLYTTITVAMYCGLIAISLIAQGLMAVYYFTRVRHMRAYLAETPGWIADIQRTPYS